MPLLQFVKNVASRDDFDIVVRQIENLEAHVFKISVSIHLANHCSLFVIAPSRGICHTSEISESRPNVVI